MAQRQQRSLLLSNNHAWDAKVGLALVKRGQRQLAEIETSTGISFFAKFGDLTTDEIRRSSAHYLVGLGCLGLEDRARAKTEFKQAAGLDIYNLWARVMLSQLE